MSAETERSASSLADLRKDLGGGGGERSSSGPSPTGPLTGTPLPCKGGTAAVSPSSVPGDPAGSASLAPSPDCTEDGQDGLQKVLDPSFDGEANSLHQCRPDAVCSYMEVDVSLPTIRHAVGPSAQNLEPNVMEASGSSRLELSQQATLGKPSPPETAAGTKDAILVCYSQKIAVETSSSEASVRNRETAPNVPDKCLSSVTHLQDQNNEKLLQSSDKDYRNVNRAYVTQKRADSLESLTLVCDSMDIETKWDVDYSRSKNVCNSKLSGFPKSWSTPSAVAFLDKSSKAESRSLDHAEINDGDKSTENSSFLQSGSSTESASAAISASDGIERAREILGHPVDISFSTPVGGEPSPKCAQRSRGGAKGTRELGVNGTGGKGGKGSSEKKRRGLSWYSVLSPTYKSRSDDFRRIFKDIPSSERLIVDYSCALQKDILVQGRLYISQSWICFYANIFRWETLLTIRCKDIVKLTKERTARVIPNAIQILTKDEKFFFTSFGTRDKTYLVLDHVWRNGTADETMSRRELWQWVHYSYGEELGLTSGDEDYIPLSAEEKISFQTRVQKEESKLQKLSQTNNASAVTDRTKESSGDYLNVNGELQPPAEEADSSVADNLSVASADDGIYLFSESQNLTESPENVIHCATAAPACLEGVVSGATSSGAEEEGEDSTGDEDVARCSGHDHFSIDVIDETLNIPVDALFEHCFTDSPLYREFVKNKKTFDVVLSPWPEEADVNGVKVRNIAYTLTLGYSIGPKYSPSTERQIMHSESRPGHFYLIDTECINGGIPYGENFYIVNRFCISKVSSNKSHLRITSELRYRKSVWGFVRSFIDKNATAGLIDSFNVMGDLLRNESDRQIAPGTGLPSAVGRRKFLRRRRPVDRSPARVPLVTDCQNQNTSKQSTPVKHFTPKTSSTVKVRNDWHVKLTVDILVRIVCFVLILLMVFNAILFYKLWSLEATAANVLLSQKPAHFSFPGYKEGRPESNEEWASLLKKQRVLHDSEINHWKDILSTSIQLMDEMIHALTDLRSSIDQRSAPIEEERSTEVPIST